MNDLFDLPALEQARRIRTGELSAFELATAYVERARRHEPDLSCFSDPRFDRALRRAKKLDATKTASPLHGVPSGVKDLDPEAGTFLRFGSRHYKWLWTPIHGEVASRMRKAGLNSFGKLTTSEFGAHPFVEPVIHPPTRNPYERAYSAGGSSGGSAAAVAAGLISIAHGADAAGSLRIPAAFCHLFAHKASRGLLPNPYRPVDPIPVSASGPLARTVEDAAALLDVLRGSEGPGGTLLEAARRTPPPLRIRVSFESGVFPTHPGIVDATRRIADVLADHGHDVQERPMLDAQVDEFLPVFQRQAANAPVLIEHLLEPSTQWLRAQGRRYASATIERLQQDLEARVMDWFDDADMWLTPTVGLLPQRVGAWADLDGEQQFRQAAQLGVFTAPFNVSGQPACSVPAGLVEGLPVGIQLVGRPGADGLVLALARSIEESTDFPRVHPPGFF